MPTCSIRTFLAFVLTTACLLAQTPARWESSGPRPVQRGQVDDPLSSSRIAPQGDAAPNLTPFQPSGWDGPIVVSKATGDNQDASDLTDGDSLFIDWAAINAGNAPTGDRFFVRLLVDDVEVGSWFADPPLPENNFVFVEDFRLDPLNAGSHTLRLVVDPDNDIAESNEDDNEFSRQIEVMPAGVDLGEEIFFFFPSVESGSGRDTGVAIANPTNVDAVVDLFLLRDDGELLESQNIVIPAGEQIARVLTELFPTARSGVKAWMAVRSTNLGLAAFFLTFTGGARNIDGAEAAVRGAGVLVFPEIFCGDGDFTEITVVGNGRVDLELRDSQGTVIETQRITLPAGQLGRAIREVGDLFNSDVPSDAYVLARGVDSSIVGYETFGAGGFLGGQNAIRSSERARTVPTALFGAQLAQVAALESVITLINPTDSLASLRLQAFETGVAGDAAASVEMTLEAGAMLRGSAAQLLGLNDFVGWLRVDSDIAGILGDVSFGDPNGQYLASVQLQRTPAQSIVASHVADGLGFFTGLTFLNPSNDPAQVRVEVFNTGGQQTGAGEFTLQPLEHRPRVLSQIIPGFPAQVGGYIRITAEPGVFAFELFSLLSGGNLLSLAAVPPQRGHGVIEGRVRPVAQSAPASSPAYPASRAKGVILDPELEFVPGDVIVKWAPGAALAEATVFKQGRFKTQVESPDGVSLLRWDQPVPKSGFMLLKESGPKLEAARLETLQWVERFNSDPAVLYAEPNYIYRPSRVPNDEFFNLQWHYAAMKLPQAWDVTVGSSSLVVAVIDSGAKFGHPDLAGRLTGGQIDMISDPVNALDGDGIDTDAEDPGDDPNGLTSSFHGTHVAGTLGAVTHNNVGVAGVNWNSPLMTVRALGAQGGTSFDIAQGIRFAAGLPNASGLLPQQAARVINMSLGGFGRSQIMADAVAAALGQNAVIVAAAGNENTDRQAYPAGYDGVISVGATDSSGGRASYSNFGPRIDVVATGGDVSEDRNGDMFPDGVLSTLWRESDNQPLFQFYEGTSMAAPHVAGIVSLVLSVNPNLSPAQVRQLLRDTAIDLGDPGFDNIFGAGLADPVAALQAAGAQPSMDPLLALSSQNLNFGTQQQQLNVVASNAGGGNLQITGVTSEVDSGGNWLDASLSLNTIFVMVNRSGLSDGDYTGRVSVSSNGGNATIAVSMRVGQEEAPDPGMIFVLALDPFTFETEASAATDSSAGFAFRISPIAAGQYAIAAGTDLDDDGFICDEGEFCGLFPISNDPVPVAVEGNQSTSGIDFDVQEPAVTQSTTGRPPREGFRVDGKRLPGAARPGASGAPSP